MSHVADHMFNGVCICSCKDCTKHVNKETVCICPDCPSGPCGMKVVSK